MGVYKLYVWREGVRDHKHDIVSPYRYGPDLEGFRGKDLNPKNVETWNRIYEQPGVD